MTHRQECLCHQTGLGEASHNRKTTLPLHFVTERLASCPMKNTAVQIAIIAGISIIVCTFMLSSAIKEYGRSLEKAAAVQSHVVTIPSQFTFRVEGGNSPLRFDVNSKP